MVQINQGIAEFSFYCPTAGRVSLVGDFNSWLPDELTMRRDADGYWRARLMLRPGVYTFRYCADGRWYTDYAAFGAEPGPYGHNSVLRVA